MNDAPESYDDEIDLKELFTILWAGARDIIRITAATAVFSVIIALALPNIYHSTATLAPASSGEQGLLGNLSQQYGGLASLAGFDLPEGALSKKDLALEVLRSRQFIGEFVKTHNIKPQLMAVDFWDSDTGELVIDDGVYDVKLKKWLDGEQPLNVDVYEKFLEQLILEDGGDGGIVKVGFKHRSPVEAQKWTNWLLIDLNNAIRNKDISEAQSAIEYLREQVRATPLAELKKVFYALIRSQTEIIMLAQVRAEYVFTTIDPAIIAEEKSEPRRALICILLTMLGGLISVVYVLVRHYYLEEKKD
ncbi:Wzz/FepE/Etk N-terminal domain-containing protein [Alphaproteobacteria bacterium]|nr:Wzz/FepE/Etk N-terminal domain-containing protein [Alphaproteobacteria bacterium]MDC0131470.1 Wzz/FepE/Etk N-terminal domain-containing protein [Alphaproteobacteria bacterium]